MEQSEEEYFQEEEAQVKNREDKRRQARGKFLEEREAAEFRQLGIAAALRKVLLKQPC